MIIFVYAADTDSKADEYILDITEYSMIWIVIGMILLTGITKNARNSSYPTWYFATWLQYTRFLSLINTSVDIDIQEFFKRIISSLYGVQIIYYDSTDSLPQNYFTVGIESFYFLINAEKVLIIFFGCAVLVLCLKILGKFVAKIKDFSDNTWKNAGNRVLIVCAYDFLIFSLLQVNYYRFDSVFDMISTLLACIFIFIYLAFTIHVFKYIKHEFNYCKEDIHSSTLLEEFKYKERFKGYYYLIFILSRIITAVVLIFAQSLKALQLVSIGLCILATILYILILKPYRDEKINYLVASSEICQLILCGCMASYLSSPESVGQLLIKWSVFITFWLGVILCIVTFFIIFFTKPTKIQPYEENDKNNNITAIINRPEQASVNLSIPLSVPKSSSSQVRVPESHPPIIESDRELNPILIPSTSNLSYYPKLAEKYRKKLSVISN